MCYVCVLCADALRNVNFLHLLHADMRLWRLTVTLPACRCEAAAVSVKILPLIQLLRVLNISRSTLLNPHLVSEDSLLHHPGIVVQFHPGVAPASHGDSQRFTFSQNGLRVFNDSNELNPRR